MNLLDLYTPEELAEKQEGFLKRINNMFADIADLRERALQIGHKLQGTAGSIGITGFQDDGRQLQIQARDPNCCLVTLNQQLTSLQTRIAVLLTRLPVLP